jgi:hypothetical protein
MGWVVLLLLISPAAYLGSRLYYRAADGPRLSLQALLPVLGFIAVIMAIFVVLAAAFGGPEEIADALSL